MPTFVDEPLNHSLKGKVDDGHKIVVGVRNRIVRKRAPWHGLLRLGVSTGVIFAVDGSDHVEQSSKKNVPDVAAKADS